MIIYCIYEYTKIYYDLNEPSVNNYRKFGIKASQIRMRVVCLYYREYKLIAYKDILSENRFRLYVHID